MDQIPKKFGPYATLVTDVELRGTSRMLSERMRKTVNPTWIGWARAVLFVALFFAVQVGEYLSLYDALTSAFLMMAVSIIFPAVVIFYLVTSKLYLKSLSTKLAADRLELFGSRLEFSADETGIRLGNMLGEHFVGWKAMSQIEELPPSYGFATNSIAFWSGIVLVVRISGNAFASDHDYAEFLRFANSKVPNGVSKHET